MQTLTVEGEKITSIFTFYQEINRVFMENEDWKIGESLDAFNDLMYGTFGAMKGKEPINIIWENLEKNKIALGFDATINFYEEKLKFPKVFNRKFIQTKIDELHSGKGSTFFEIILEIIAEHPNIQLTER